MASKAIELPDPNNSGVPLVLQCSNLVTDTSSPDPIQALHNTCLSPTVAITSRPLQVIHLVGTKGLLHQVSLNKVEHTITMDSKDNQLEVLQVAAMAMPRLKGEPMGKDTLLRDMGKMVMLRDKLSSRAIHSL